MEQEKRKTTDGTGMASWLIIFLVLLGLIYFIFNTIVFVVFLAIYLFFNFYIVSKIWSMRIPGDQTPFSIIVYGVVVLAILVLGFFALSVNGFVNS